MKDQNRKNNGQKENGQEKNAQGDREWREASKDHWEQQQPYIHWMAGVDGIGSRTMEKLIQYAGSPKEVYEMTASETEKIISARKAAALEEARKRGGALERYQEMEEKGIRFYSLYHPRYPSRLRNIPDSPYGIYVEGELPEEGIPSVAVIGSRQCSGYGQFMAELCGKELAAAGIHIISGMARGIDGISQRAALEAGGKIYAILGSGTDICYPSENRSIYVGAKTSGAVISEYPPGTSPSPLLFPRRNRIISGLADLVLIIEARHRSGTLITADMALEQGKDVYVVPGRITDDLSQGCHQMLKQGAGLFTSVKDMLEEAGLSVGIKGKAENADSFFRQSVKNPPQDEEDQVSRKVLAALDFYPRDIDCLMRETRMDYRLLVRTLSKLCMEGKADRLTAGQFIKKI